ncbi:hypothetical protein [Bacillus cereus]|uniref:hypothetical protein n=1 Tax=Bacillus cereus TaxID=1396 RepID=UPI00027AB812|nr:hypothetical protein [Bacillus cereus]EJS63487.1 hypothetical protein ICY_05324 [Bacillus cereus BAG2X1-3]
MFIHVVTKESIIVAYSTNWLDDSFEVSLDVVPDDLVAGYYKLVDGQVIIDEELKESIIGNPKPDPLPDEPKPDEVEVLKQQNALLTKQVAGLNLSNKALAQQQASLLKTLAEKGII